MYGPPFKSNGRINTSSNLGWNPLGAWSRGDSFYYNWEKQSECQRMLWCAKSTTWLRWRQVKSLTLKRCKKLIADTFEGVRTQHIFMPFRTIKVGCVRCYNLKAFLCFYIYLAPWEIIHLDWNFICIYWYLYQVGWLVMNFFRFTYIRFAKKYK